jgi:hypothetical protein
LLQRAIAGKRSVAFITGEPGIGKTSMVEMAIEQVASDRICILRGCCTELLGAGEAFLPLIEALQAGIAGPHRPFLIQTLRQHAPTWLAQMPAVLDPAERSLVERQAFGVSRERMLREFCDFLEAFSRAAPCILVLEDCHWSDVATLDALSHLSRRDHDARLLVMATYRPSEGALDVPPVLDLNRDLRIHGRCVDLALGSLVQSDVERHLVLRFADAGLAATLATSVFARSAGHPLFVTALIDDMIGRGTLAQVDGIWVLQGTLLGLMGEVPGHVRDMLTQQIGRLSARDQQLLEVASADDGEFSAASVAAAADADVVAVERCFDALAVKGVVLCAAGEAEWPDGTRSGRYGFQHAMYREVLYRRLGPGRRARIHRRLGEGLERGYLHRTADIAAVLALHFEQSREADKAIRYLGLAADKAARRFAGEDAARYLTRALAMVDLLPGDTAFVTRLNLLRQRGWARRSGGDLTGSLDDLRALIALAAAAGDVRLEAAGLMDLSRFSMFADRRQCLPTAAAATALAGSFSGSPDDAALASLIRGSGASIDLWFRPWRDDAAALCREAVRLTADAADAPTIVRRCWIEAVVDLLTGNYRNCLAVSQHAKLLASQTGDVFAFALNNVLRAFAQIHLGLMRDAMHDTAEALTIAERSGRPSTLVMCRLTMAWIAFERLDFASAAAWVETNYRPSFDENSFVFLFHRMVIARIHLGNGDTRAAWHQLREVEHVFDRASEMIDYPLRVTFLCSMSEHGVQAGDPDQARLWAMRLLTVASAAPDRHYCALARWLLAEVATLEQRPDEARDHLAQAISIVEGDSLPLAARRIYETAARFHACAGGERLAAEYRARRDQARRTLAVA